MTTPTRHFRTRSLLATVALTIPAILIGAGLSAPAQAGYVVTLEQVGSNVVATGMGAIDLDGLTAEFPESFSPFITPNTGVIETGLPTPTVPSAIQYMGGGAEVSGPTSFGSGGTTDASTGSGDPVGIEPVTINVPHVPNQLFLYLPSSYVSGNALSSTATWDDATFATLGVTPGTYEWTWGTGPNQNFTLDAVPAPPIGCGLPALLAVGGILLGTKLLERGRRRRLPFG